jgi:hypothetical protein
MPITKASSNAVAPAAKGDLVVGNATNDSGVLAVGSTSQVLTVDSTTATGLKWATASAGGMTLLSTTTLSGASTTVSSIDQTYNSLFLLVFGMTNAGNGSFEIAPNGTTTISTTSGVARSTAFGQVNGRMRPLSSQQILETNANNICSIEIDNYASTTRYKSWTSSGGFFESGGGVSNMGCVAGGSITTNSAISSLEFSNNGGSWTAGTVLIYGVK